MVQTESTIEPNLEAHEAYKFYLERYIETYPEMKDSMHKMSQHEAAQSKSTAEG